MKGALTGGKITRRAFCREAGALTVFAPVVFAGCEQSEPSSCSPPDLDPALKTERERLEYVDIGPDRTRHCRQCRQWVEPAESGGCGTCKVMKGPVHPRGTCKVFMAAG